MRFKYYLRGCGLGILLATVILMIGFHRSESGKLSDEQIRQRASELGMVTPVEVEQLPAGTQGAGVEAMESQKTNGDISKSTGEPETSAADAKRPQDSGDQDGTGDTDKPEEDKSGVPDKPNGDDRADGQDTTDKSDRQDDSETVTVVVRRGEVCRELSEELYELGLVEDAETFRKFMQENGYDNLIRVGEFELTVGMEQEEIAKILTTKPE